MTQPASSALRPAHIASLLRSHAVNAVAKAACACDPETKTHGDGVVRDHIEQPKTDPGTASVKDGMPADGTIATAVPTSGSPDRLTTADGQGGITTTAAQPTTDPNLAGVTAAMPTNAPGNKQASLDSRISALRQLCQSAAGVKAAAAPAVPAAVPAAPSPEGQSKEAGDEALPIHLLAKLASDALATEAGLAFYTNLYEVADGEKAANERIQAALEASSAFQQAEMDKAAAVRIGIDRAGEIYHGLAGMLTEQDADEILKQASQHDAYMGALDDQLCKFAYAEGMDAAAADELAMEAGGAPPEAPAEDAPMSQEELIAALQEMINTGEITPEELAQALSEIEAEAAAGAPADPAAAPADPAVDPAAAAAPAAV